jgi:hypothetical protein
LVEHDSVWFRCGVGKKKRARLLRRALPYNEFVG